MKFRVAVPVECHNGHKATAYFSFSGLESRYEGVPHGEACACPKWEAGTGWKPCGDPYLQRQITWNETTRGGETKLYFSTPIGHYEIGADGFMYGPWVCKYPDVAAAKAAAQADYDKRLKVVSAGRGTFEEVKEWKDYR